MVVAGQQNFAKNDPLPNACFGRGSLCLGSLEREGLSKRLLSHDGKSKKPFARAMPQDNPIPASHYMMRFWSGCLSNGGFRDNLT